MVRKKSDSVSFELVVFTSWRIWWKLIKVMKLINLTKIYLTKIYFLTLPLVSLLITISFKLWNVYVLKWILQNYRHCFRCLPFLSCFFLDIQQNDSTTVFILEHFPHLQYEDGSNFDSSTGEVSRGSVVTAWDGTTATGSSLRQNF